MHVGDHVIVDLDDQGKSTWLVVGLLFDLSGNQTTAYIPIEIYNQEVNQVGRAGVVEIRSDVTTAEAQDAVAKDLKTYLDANGFKVGSTETSLKEQADSGARFSILTTLLLVMTCLMAMVGSFGLSGTLSINVLERRREIGVMRAVGASSGDVGFIFVTEGVLLGIVSWLVAVPISVLGGQYFVQAIGATIQLPIQYYYSPQGVWIWLAIVLTLSLLASWLPARRATLISVRESLAYE